ncbi:MAG: FAD-dependent oxidoreductase [Rhodospirillaceae bacterium]|nr:FAD-dependent oxidoreductase [Rhodospirillaceae bacterium]
MPGTQSSYDVIVVGLGAAGASAAIEARAAGADVLVLERASAGGGSTVYAAGHIYLGGGTRVQKLNGFDDTPEEMFKFLMASMPVPDPEKARVYADDSPAHFDWIERQGIIFNNGFYAEKHFEHDTEEGLAWTGNEKAWPFSTAARPAARGHKVTLPGGVTKSGEGGSHLVNTLIDRARAAGVRLEYDARVLELLTENGRVVGVRYKQFGKESVATCRRGAIVATGGFGANKAMVKKLCPELDSEAIYILGAPYADGSGIELGLSAGAATGYIGAFATAPLYPPANLLKGILVNKFGQRFINEDTYHSRSCTACLRQPEGVAYLICDNAVFARPEFGGQPLVDAWEDVAAMEAALKMPAGALQKTMADYNAHAATGNDPAFHKIKEYLQPLMEAPYAALDCSLGKAAYTGFTLGGLKTTKDGEVLGMSGRPIAGLYAAGACASNIAQDSMGYASGTCIGESTYFGRRAGRRAATH